MKKMRLIGAALAVCMTFACMLPAGAAEQSPDVRRSAYAGTTMNVKVIDLDTNTSRAIQVAVPANATEAQEVALVQNAVAASSAAASRVVTRGAVDQISWEYFNNPLVAPTVYTVGGGTLEQDYMSLQIYFHNVIPINGANEFTVEVKNNTNGNVASRTTETDILYTAYAYVLSSAVRLNDGDQITVKATPDTGAIQTSDCYICACTWEVGP